MIESFFFFFNLVRILVNAHYIQVPSAVGKHHQNGINEGEQLKFTFHLTVWP